MSNFGAKRAATMASRPEFKPTRQGYVALEAAALAVAEQPCNPPELRAGVSAVQC